jgi:hypothetical protein
MLTGLLFEQYTNKGQFYLKPKKPIKWNVLGRKNSFTHSDCHRIERAAISHRIKYFSTLSHIILAKTPSITIPSYC